MSQEPSQPSGEEEINLAIEFQGLSITVKGPVNSSLDFVRRLSGSDRDAQSSVAHHDSFESAPASSQRAETRADIEASFAPCPVSVRGWSSRLLATDRYQPVERLQRAWGAGQWAEATRRGRVQSPNRTPTIDLPNRIYVVLKSDTHPRPAIYRTSRDYFAAVGNLAGSSTITHGFPSDTEAKAYLAAAGEEFPEA